VGLRENSLQLPQQRAGFRANNTLGEMYDIIAESDLSITYFRCSWYQHIFESIRPGTTLCLMAFYWIYLKSIWQIIPNIDVVAVCPKGMGPSVKNYMYRQRVNGAGINTVFMILSR